MDAMRLRGVATVALAVVLLAPGVAGVHYARTPPSEEEFTTVIEDMGDHAGFLDIREVAVGEDGQPFLTWRITLASNATPPWPVEGFVYVWFNTTDGGDYQTGFTQDMETIHDDDSPSGFHECWADGADVYCRIGYQETGVWTDDEIRDISAASYAGPFGAGVLQDWAPGPASMGAPFGFTGDDYTVLGVHAIDWTPADLTIRQAPQRLELPSHGTLSFAFTVTNEGEETTPVDLRIEGLPANATVDLDTHQTEAAAWDPMEVDARIHVDGNVSYGDHDLTLHAQGRDTNATADLTLHIPAPEEPTPSTVRLRADPTLARAGPGATVTHDLTLVNLGDDAAHFALAVEEAPDGYAAFVQPARGRLSGGQAVPGTLSVTVPADADPGPHDLELNLTSGDKTRTHRLQLEVHVPEPVLPAGEGAAPGATIPGPSALLAAAGMAAAVLVARRRD